MSPHTIIFLLTLAPLLTVCVQVKPTNVKDSYLSAYSQVHGGKLDQNPSSKNDKDYSLHPGAEFSGYPSAEGPIYRPGDGYPGSEYPYPSSVSAPQYGPPKPIYGPPKPVYGPPPSYGPPVPVPIYGALYEVPHAMLGFFDKLKFKIDLFTIGKIILKLMIFKKIVSLIAILCLLLFIPSLKHHKEDYNENSSAEDSVIMMRGSKGTNGEESLNNVAAFVIEAIKRYNYNSTDISQECENRVYCESEKVLEYVQRRTPTQRLTQLYMKEL